MTIKDSMRAEMNRSMKEKIRTDVAADIMALDIRINTLKLALSNITKHEKMAKAAEGDKLSLSVLKRELKSRLEAAEVYAKHGNDDRAHKEKMEADVIREFLPQEKSEQETQEIVDEVISSIPEDKRNIKSMGMIMGKLKKYDNLDMKMVSNMVRQKLQ